MWSYSVSDSVRAWEAKKMEEQIELEKQQEQYEQQKLLEQQGEFQEYQLQSFEQAIDEKLRQEMVEETQRYEAVEETQSQEETMESQGQAAAEEASQRQEFAFQSQKLQEENPAKLQLQPQDYSQERVFSEAQRQVESMESKQLAAAELQTFEEAQASKMASRVSESQQAYFDRKNLEDHKEEDSAQRSTFDKKCAGHGPGRAKKVSIKTADFKNTALPAKSSPAETPKKCEEPGEFPNNPVTNRSLFADSSPKAPPEAQKDNPNATPHNKEESSHSEGNKGDGTFHASNESMAGFFNSRHDYKDDSTPLWQRFFRGEDSSSNLRQKAIIEGPSGNYGAVALSQTLTPRLIELIQKLSSMGYEWARVVVPIDSNTNVVVRFNSKNGRVKIHLNAPTQGLCEMIQALWADLTGQVARHGIILENPTFDTTPETSNYDR